MSTTYTDLLIALADLLGAQTDVMDEDSMLEIQHNDLLLVVYPHPEQAAMVVEAQICEIDALADPAIQMERLLMLHKTNNLARLTHGAVGTISEDNMLLVAHTLPLETTTVPMLLETLDTLLDHAVHLRQAWTEAWSAFEKLGEPTRLDTTPLGIQLA